MPTQVVGPARLPVAQGYLIILINGVAHEQVTIPEKYSRGLQRMQACQAAVPGNPRQFCGYRLHPPRFQWQASGALKGRVEHGSRDHRTVAQRFRFRSHEHRRVAEGLVNTPVKPELSQVALVRPAPVPARGRSGERSAIRKCYKSGCACWLLSAWGYEH